MFAVDIILVIGSERLQIEMKRRFENHTTTRGEILTLVKLDKSGGCVDRDEEYVSSRSFPYPFIKALTKTV